MKSTLLLLIVAWVPIGHNAWAQHEHETSEAPLHAEQPAHAHIRHHVAVTPSLTSSLSAEEATGAIAGIGLDYEEHLGEVWGVGVYAEMLFAQPQTYLLTGLPLFIHPFSHFHLLLAPELKWAHEAEAWSRIPAFRAGAAYDIHFDHLSVSPTLNADFIEGQTELNYGLSIGWGF